MHASASTVVAAPPEEVFKFIIDPLTYTRIDTKVTLIDVLEKGEGTLRLRVRFYVIFPMLESGMTVNVRLHPFRRIALEAEPNSVSLPGRLLLEEFQGEFELEEAAGGTRVVRTETFVTKDTLLGRLANRLGQDWLTQHLEEIELPRLKQLIEARPDEPH